MSFEATNTREGRVAAAARSTGGGHRCRLPPVAWLVGVDDVVGRCEARLCQTLVAALPLMILVNVTSRAIGQPIFWMDELAIYTMVWLAMIGLSLTVHNRDAVAVTLVQNVVPARLRRALVVVADAVVVAFAVALGYLSYLWFDPVGLARAGFDVAEFSTQTFNYVYQEPTATLGVPKFCFWLIVPLVAVTTTLHGVNNLIASVTAAVSGVDAEARTDARGNSLE
ncbi:TRAP transporter small permease [Arhodomonas sp. AD133]|uniref:TRAP transporter small permease n=1 Tax=Arhodomonas sp. AD133 TaxID=3415009 RepID=UPI003EB82009